MLFLLKLLKHVKLVVKCELISKNIKKAVACFDQKVACWKKSTGDPREESITQDPEEKPITEHSRSALYLRSLNRTLPMRNLSTISMKTLRSFRTLNNSLLKNVLCFL